MYPSTHCVESQAGDTRGQLACSFCFEDQTRSCAQLSRRLKGATAEFHVASRAIVPGFSGRSMPWPVWRTINRGILVCCTYPSMGPCPRIHRFSKSSESRAVGGFATAVTWLWPDGRRSIGLDLAVGQMCEPNGWLSVHAHKADKGHKHKNRAMNGRLQSDNDGHGWAQIREWCNRTNRARKTPNVPHLPRKNHRHGVCTVTVSKEYSGGLDANTRQLSRGLSFFSNTDPRKGYSDAGSRTKKESSSKNGERRSRQWAWLSRLHSVLLSSKIEQPI